jgi:SAM-dependent methyltransferase
MAAFTAEANQEVIHALTEIVRQRQGDFLSFSASKPLTSGQAQSPETGPAALPPGCARIKARPLNRGCFVELFTKTQVFHRSLSHEDFPAFLETALTCGSRAAFGNILFRCQDGTHIRQVSAPANNKGCLRLLETKEPLPRPGPGQSSPQESPAMSPNRQKNYLLPAGRPVPFLVHLGIMTGEGKIIASKQGKFRQINRFLEYVADILPADRSLRIVDFGCGSSYLTFGLYYFLKELRGIPVRIIGVDAKADAIARCAALAKLLKYEGLCFRNQTIEDFAARDAEPAPDLLVSLHACDTATDYALAYGIQRRVPAILSVPCCQHELNALLRPGAVSGDSGQAFATVMAHGLLKERFAALATDAIRVNLLEQAGYRVTVAELVGGEDTPKNALIRGVLKPQAAGTETCPAQDPLSKFLGVSLSLEKLLESEAGWPTPTGRAV